MADRPNFKNKWEVGIYNIALYGMVYPVKDTRPLDLFRWPIFS